MPVTLRARVAACLLTGTLLGTGCGGDTAGPETTAEPTPTASATPTPYVFATPPTVSRPELTVDGLGPVRLGAPVTEAVARGWAIRDDRCGWRTGPELLSDGVELYFADDRISEIWLGSTTLSTARGARVGMTVEQIETLYAGELAYERRDSLGGRVILPVVRHGERELLFFALGDEDAEPGPWAPVTAIGARASGLALTRPGC